MQSARHPCSQSLTRSVHRGSSNLLYMRMHLSERRRQCALTRALGPRAGSTSSPASVTKRPGGAGAACRRSARCTCSAASPAAPDVGHAPLGLALRASGTPAADCGMLSGRLAWAATALPDGHGPDTAAFKGCGGASAVLALVPRPAHCARWPVLAGALLPVGLLASAPARSAAAASDRPACRHAAPRGPGVAHMCLRAQTTCAVTSASPSAMHGRISTGAQSTHQLFPTPLK